MLIAEVLADKPSQTALMLPAMGAVDCLKKERQNKGAVLQVAGLGDRSKAVLQSRYVSDGFAVF